MITRYKGSFIVTTETGRMSMHSPNLQNYHRYPLHWISDEAREEHYLKLEILRVHREYGALRSFSRRFYKSIRRLEQWK